MRRVSSPRLAGRVVELGWLVDALAEATVAGSAVALVAGEPGVGKTRLLAEFADGARATGAVVLVGGCMAMSGMAPPYLPLTRALGQLPGQRDLAVRCDA